MKVTAIERCATTDFAICEWLGGRVQLVTYFALNLTCMLLDGAVKCRYTGITADEFKNLQRQCQEAADSLER